MTTIGYATSVTWRLSCPRNCFIIFSIYACLVVCKVFPTRMEVWGCGCPGNTSAQCQASPRFVPGTWCTYSNVSSWAPAGSSGGASGAKLCPGFFSDAIFPLKSHVVWKPYSCEIRGIVFLIQQAAPHSSLFGYSVGKVRSWKEKCPSESRRRWTVHYPGGRTVTWVCAFVVWQMYYIDSSLCCGLSRQHVSITEIKRGLAGWIRIALYTLTVNAVHIKHWISASQLQLGDMCLSAYDTRSARGHGYVPLSWAGEHYSQVIMRS